MRVVPLCFSVLLFSSGCVVHETRPLPPPMSEAEAVQRGESWCSSHGYECRTRRVARRADVVEVVFDAEGHGAQGPLRLEFGSWDRRLLRVEVPAALPHGPRPAAESEVVGGLRGEVGLPYEAFSRVLPGLRENVQG